MAYDFDGGASADKITTNLTAHSTQRSISLWVYRDAAADNLDRLWDKRTAGAQVEIMFFSVPGASNYQFEKAWSGDDGVWFMAAPTADEWHNIIVTYDYSSTSNAPVMYVDGVSQSVTTTTGPTGTVDTNTDAYVLGNRGNDNSRGFNGKLGEWAVWNKILSTDEITGLGKGMSALFYPISRVDYAPMINPLYSYHTAALTNSGATQYSHPPIFYPTKEQLAMIAAAAAPATAVRDLIGGMGIVPFAR